MIGKVLKKAFSAVGKAGKKGGGAGIEIYPDDVFLVSYPKSGNTWVRFILANLEHKNAEINFTNIHEYSPAVYTMEGYKWGAKRPRIIKSHELYNPSFPKVIYVVRDGRDAYVSYYHYLRSKLPAGMTFADFIRKGSMPFGRWSDHVLSWLDKYKEGPLLLIKYEDLHLDPVNTVKRMLDFISIKEGEEEIKRAVEKSSFASMSEAEQRHGRGKYKSGPEVFMRKGEAGDWQRHFEEEEKAVFKEKENGVLIRLGYEKDDRW